MYRRGATRSCSSDDTNNADEPEAANGLLAHWSLMKPGHRALPAQRRIAADLAAAKCSTRTRSTGSTTSSGNSTCSDTHSNCGNNNNNNNDCMSLTSSCHSTLSDCDDHSEVDSLDLADIDIDAAAAAERREGHHCSSLYGGALFCGAQTSGDRSYTVEVLLKHVDWDNSFLCGDLTIHNLTPQFPTMTTFFEAEIIGDKHSFVTNKWEADERVDLQHWMQFSSFRCEGLDKCWTDKDFVYDFRNSDFVYMRWKEHFLVHDHTIRNVKGASFAGFYYICLCRSTGVIEGFYYHSASEWFQALKLKIVEQQSFQSFEFR